MGTEHNYSPFTYKIIRRRRKTVGIKITEKGEIIVISPFKISEETISNIIKQKEKWILSKIAWIRENQLTYKDKVLKTGEKLLYLGKEIDLQIVENGSDTCSIELLDDKFIVYVNKNQKDKEDIIKDIIIHLYKEKARDVFIQRTSHYSKIIEVSPQRISIKNQKTVWGSCSSKRNINYNYRLIMAPIDIIDYVVVHELCHLVHMNHSKKYWDVVESVLADYKRRRQWLKTNGFMLKI